MDINRIIAPSTTAAATAATGAETSSAQQAAQNTLGRSGPSAFQPVPARPASLASTSTTNLPRTAALPTGQQPGGVMSLSNLMNPVVPDLPVHRPIALRPGGIAPPIQPPVPTITGTAPAMAAPVHTASGSASAASASASASASAGPSAVGQTSSQRHVLTNAHHRSVLDGLAANTQDKSIIARFLEALEGGFELVQNTRSGTTSRTINTLPEFQALDLQQRQAVVNQLIAGDGTGNGLNASARSVLQKHGITDMGVKTRRTRQHGLVRAPVFSAINQSAVDAVDGMRNVPVATKKAFKQFVGYLQRERPQRPNGTTPIDNIAAFRSLTQADQDTMIDNAVHQRKVRQPNSANRLKTLEAELRSRRG